MSRIRKTSETRPLTGHVVNTYSESESNAYSCDYINNTFGETVLYNNTTGSNVQTISLSDSSANYKYIEVFYRSTDNIYSSVKVYEPNGKNFDMTSHYYLTGTMYAKSSCYQFSANQINRITFGGWSVSSSSSAGEASDIFITRVVGYK